MKVKDIIKKQTTIIALAVIVVVMATIGVSYAVFFDVKNSDTQVITAGTLALTVNGSAVTLNNPGTEASAKTFTYTVKNTGNLPAKYSLYVYAETDNAVDLSYVKISINGTAAKTLTSLTSATIDSKTRYTIETNVNVNDITASKTLKMWIDEESINADISTKKLDLKLYIVSEVNES